MDRIGNLPEFSARSLVKNEKITPAENQDNKGLWVRSTDKKGHKDYYLDVTSLSEKTYFTTVQTHEASIKVPLVIKMLKGEKINLRDKVDALLVQYKQAVIDSRSHNLLMATINGLKLASLSHILARLGVPEEELRKLRKDALEEAIAENHNLMKENIFNMELFELIGGNVGKNGKAQQKVLNEIETQIMTQAQRLEIDGYYTKERLLEMRVESVQAILGKFQEEQQNLKYELEYLSASG